MLQASDGGAHNVGQATHGIRGDEEGHGTGLGGHDAGEVAEWAAIAEGPAQAHGDVAESHDQARHGEGKHAERVEEGAAFDGGAHEQVRDENAEDDVNGHRCAGEHEAVGDGGEAVGGGECFFEVVARECAG